ncbi:MAG: MFS transporter [Fusobacteriaceae bacterium]
MIFSKKFKLKKYSSNVKNIMLLNFISSFVIQGIFFVFIGIHIKTLGFGESVVGKVLAVNSLSIGFGSLLSAYCLGILGRKKSLIIGVITICIGMIGIGASTQVSNLMFFAIFTGIGYSFPSTSVGVLLAENSRAEEKVGVFSRNFVIQSIGVICGSYLGGGLNGIFSKFFDLRNVIPIMFYICALLVLIMIIPVLKLEETTVKTAKKSKNLYITFRKIMNQKKACGFIIYNTIIGFGAGLVVPFFSVYLKYQLNIDSASVGGIMALSQVGLVIGGISVPYVSKILGKENTIIICQLLSIPFLISIAFPQGIVIVAISFLLRSTLMNLNQPLIQNISMDIVEEQDRALMSSLILMTSYLTRAVSVIIAGYVMENISYNLPYYVTVVLYLSGTYTFYKIFRKIR